MSEVWAQAKAITAHGPNITYPSRASASHVRTVMQGLINLIDRHRQEEDARDEDESLWT